MVACVHRKLNESTLENSLTLPELNFTFRHDAHRNIRMPAQASQYFRLKTCYVL